MTTKAGTIESDRKLRKFHELFTTPGTEYHNNAVKSYVASGYKESVHAKYAASRLLHSDKFGKLLTTTIAKTQKIVDKRREISGEYADNATIETYERAVSSGDITNQVACCRILQQRCGQLSDRLVVDVEDSRRLDDSHRLQAKRIAALITSGRMLLPSTFTPVTETIDIQPVVCADNDDNDTDVLTVHNDTQVIDNQ